MENNNNNKMNLMCNYTVEGYFLYYIQYAKSHTDTINNIYNHIINFPLQWWDISNNKSNNTRTQTPAIVESIFGVHAHLYNIYNIYKRGCGEKKLKLNED